MARSRNLIIVERCQRRHAQGGPEFQRAAHVDPRGADPVAGRGPGKDQRARRGRRCKVTDIHTQGSGRGLVIAPTTTTAVGSEMVKVIVLPVVATGPMLSVPLFMLLLKVGEAAATEPIVRL